MWLVSVLSKQLDGRLRPLLCFEDSLFKINSVSKHDQVRSLSCKRETWGGGGGRCQEACRWEGFPVSRQQQGSADESNLNINLCRRGHFTTLPPIRDTDSTLGERVGFKNFIYQ